MCIRDRINIHRNEYLYRRATPWSRNLSGDDEKSGENPGLNQRGKQSRGKRIATASNDVTAEPQQDPQENYGMHHQQKKGGVSIQDQSSRHNGGRQREPRDKKQ